MRQFGRYGFGAAPVGNPNVAPGNLPLYQYGPYHKNDKFWFIYQTPNIASLAAAATATNTIVFDNDSAFEWTKTTYTVDKTNAVVNITTKPLPFVTVQIQDTGQGSYYSNAAIPVYALASDSDGLPYVMPAPQIIAPNASLQFNWVSFSTAGGGNETYTNLRLQLHGWKIRR